MSEPAPEPPPLITPVARPAVVVRVTVGLVLFGMINLAQSIVSTVAALRNLNLSGGRIDLSAPLGCLAYWIAAWLVWNNKRIIWPILAYLAALGLGGVVGSGLMCVIGLPPKLIHTVAVNGPGWLVFCIAYLVLTVTFLAWLLAEALRVDWRPACTAPRSWWLRPVACAVYSTLFGAAAVAAILALLSGAWTEPVLARARQKMGKDYDYQLLSYHLYSVNGHTTHRAVVLAYSETELNQVALDWEN